ncbi:hypothetical protein CFP56_013348 [Quercus suber]|uniref:Uncharacterized protein n=1 Tax=Quercus suber TaxID=58331 RepID=A0AAW0KTP8_QUESU
MTLIVPDSTGTVSTIVGIRMQFYKNLPRPSQHINPWLDARLLDAVLKEIHSHTFPLHHLHFQVGIKVACCIEFLYYPDHANL